jgi:hypothetical protein
MQNSQPKLTVRVSFGLRIIFSMISTSTHAVVDPESVEVVTLTVTVRFDRFNSVSNGFRMARSIQNVSDATRESIAQAREQTT